MYVAIPMSINNNKLNVNKLVIGAILIFTGNKNIHRSDIIFKLLYV
jgi:hypothetical protein